MNFADSFFSDTVIPLDHHKVIIPLFSQGKEKFEMLDEKGKRKGLFPLLFDSYQRLLIICYQLPITEFGGCQQCQQG